MRLLTTTLALALALPATALAQTPPPLATEYKAHGDDARVLVAAHRGYWRGAPENSLPSFEQAIERKIDMIELDVMRTSDGQLVLMHDTTVNRTTNGTGTISAMTLAQIKALRLRAGLGGAQAAMTDLQVPTLKEALQLIGTRALINLDKAWAYRDQILQELIETGTVETAVFKSSASVDEVQAFRAKDPRILYSHIVNDGNAASLTGFGDNPPDSFEIIFDRLTDAQIQPAAVAAVKAQSRVFINTMWKGLAANYTDEASLIDPALGWVPVIERHRADVIQTDNPDELQRHLRGIDVSRPANPANAVRVQGEDYSTDGKGVGYADQDDENRGGTVYRGSEGVDVCDQEGARVVCWIRGGEWLKYQVQITRPGAYRVWGRFSSPYRPAGRITLELPSRSQTIDIESTTSHNAFSPQTVIESVELAAGTHTYYVRVDAEAYQNFNLDYLQFDRITDEVSEQEEATVGGVVAGTLSLTLATTPPLGVFQPGVERTYETHATARVVSSALDTTLTVTGGKLTNDQHALAQPLHVRADSSPFVALTGPVALKTWNAPVVAESVPLGLRQTIGAAEPLRTGAYTTTLTFTLSTTAP
ncbi:carbohydrate-binding protein [Solirubrobacter sp. CPCC 204708]|uniref:Glycerophosphodiester phosphodiesterase family protein n=1 Tax=Solirubrobacter deserti TaxID=2282478 RepID=A0ABT4RSU7_9ACTN|nr:glycerophosphodiester phosphodiesterase family protein [Solirubrobacter deserti]MBE2316436.1 carbohydrate-binding protein [Solirubrobacter deserti]MDA0141639.1 glycerophosphodiester phosphodiesterase family protein [Solirubrobacter deserti]